MCDTGVSLELLDAVRMEIQEIKTGIDEGLQMMKEELMMLESERIEDLPVKYSQEQFVVKNGVVWIGITLISFHNWYLFERLQREEKYFEGFKARHFEQRE